MIRNPKQLKAMLLITFLCGCGFMGIKFFEYKAKIDHGYLLGSKFNYSKVIEHEHEAHAEEKAATETHHAGAVFAAPNVPAYVPAEKSLVPSAAAPPSGLVPSATHIDADGHAGHGADDHGHDDHAADGHGAHGGHGEKGLLPADGRPANIHIFFSIYFMMTGLHGIHVLIGMAVIAWLFVICRDGRFGPSYFTPVEVGGLYWHLVDLIWIFLFPLMYLI